MIVNTAQVTLPIDPTVFSVSVFTLGLILGSIVISLVLNGFAKTPTSWQETSSKLGLDGVPEALMVFAIVIWAGLLLLLISGMFWIVAHAAYGLNTLADSDPDELRWSLFRLTGLVAVTAAVIALPFALLRTQYNKRQTDAAEAALLNNKLDAAFAGLSARKTQTSRTRAVIYKHDDETITTSETPDFPFEVASDAIEVERGPWQIISEEVDDIVTRSTAIDRLEGLAVEHPEQAPRIASILSLYVRELSREYPAQKMPPDCETPDEINTWAHSLAPVRSDMEKAVQTLGHFTKKVPNYDPETIRIDLRETNLQGFNLSNINLAYGRLANAQMQGANLNWATLDRANLSDAQLQGAKLRGARLQRTYLIAARLQAADLFGAKLQGVNMWRTMLNGTNLEGANLQGVNFTGAIFDPADLAHQSRSGAQFRDLFGDASTILPSRISRPPHWPAFKMGNEDFHAEHQKWRADPNNYTPPDPPDTTQPT